MRRVESPEFRSWPSTPSAIFVPAPMPPRPRPYGVRRLAVAAGAAVIFLLALSVHQRWYLLEGPGAAFYWAHDNLFLPLKGVFWTALFPIGTFMWVAAAAVLLALLLLSYLIGIDPLRGLQTKFVHRGCERFPKRVISLFRLGRRIGLRGELIQFVARARLVAHLNDVRDILRQFEGNTAVFEEDRFIRDLHLVIELDQDASGTRSRQAIDSIGTLLLAVRLSALRSEANGLPTYAASRAAEMEEGRNLDRLVQAQIEVGASEQKSLLHMLLGLLVRQRDSASSRLARSSETYALRQEVIERERAVAHLANLLDQGEARAAGAWERSHFGSDGYAALAALLLAASLLGLRGGRDTATLRIALHAIHAVERLAVSNTLRHSEGTPGSLATTAAAALANTDARLHAAALARSLDTALAASYSTWQGIADIRDRSRTSGLAIAAASEAVEPGAGAL